MKEKDVREFLKFRKKFTNLEWHELSQAIFNREKEKAAKMVLDDFDIKMIVERIDKSPLVDID